MTVKRMNKDENGETEVTTSKRDAQNESKNGKDRAANGFPLNDVSYINVGEEDQMEISGYELHRGHQILTWVLIMFTLFFLRLIFFWKPSWFLRMTHVRCTLRKATKVLMVDQYQLVYVEDVFILSEKDCYKSPNNSNEKKNGESDNEDVSVANVPNSNKLVLPSSEGALIEVDKIRYFENKKIKYVWTNDTEFLKMRGLDSVSCSYFYQQHGLHPYEQYRRRITFGPNAIEVPVHGVFKLLFEQILSPFYVFQIFSVCLWYSEQYYYYASCIIVMSTFSITVTLLQIRKNERSLRDTIQSSDAVSVCRGNEVYESLSSDDLVPGDLIAIPAHGCIMQCDAILISGNCIVNESMLTGESVPITKTPIPEASNNRDIPYDFKEHSKHTLFCGTKIIQTRYYGSEKVMAVVMRTGFTTSKGELVRSIMFPKPVDFKFHRDSMLFIGILFGIAFLGFIYSVVIMVIQKVTASGIIMNALDLITIAVPPALPAAITVGIAYAQARLKRQGIYCISPRSINISGCVDCVCFDKTGTLTEDGLDLWGVVPVSNSNYVEVVKNVSILPKEQFIIGMATCHSLTIIDGQLTGDPLDMKMFEATGWILEEPAMDVVTQFDIIMPTVVKPNNATKTDLQVSHEEPTFEVGVLRQFPFSSSLQRMCVIAKVLGASNFEVYAKGSPEAIASLSNPQSVPADFSEVLMQYTRHGYRVLALAYKSLKTMDYSKVLKISREQVESNLIFLGLLVMENRLKPQTSDVISVLKRADIRTVMITGDNMLTALSVARDCGMIDNNHKVILVNTEKSSEDSKPTVHFVYTEKPNKEAEEKYTSKDCTEVIIEKHWENFHIALDGKSYQDIKEYFPELLTKLIVRGIVFARMSPDQKQQLIEHYQELNYYVAMCGDGANDCGALKTAHAGISLSEAEASIASPFTSKTQNISCVPILIREGRAAMSTSFGIFKYMACYSLTQFCSVVILYSVSSDFSNFEFLYSDLFLTTFFAAVFGRTEAYEFLVKEPPPSSLISVTPLASLVLHMLIIVGFQVCAFVMVQYQPWYHASGPDENNQGGVFENYSIFAISMFQYITLAICFAEGTPYRKNILSNRWFLFSVILTTCATIYVDVYPCKWIVNLLEITMPPYMSYSWIIVGLAAVNFVLCFLCERFFVGVFVFKYLRKKYKIFQTLTEHERIEGEIRNTAEWPLALNNLNMNFLPQFNNSENLATLTTPAQTSDKDEGLESNNDSIKTKSKMEVNNGKNPYNKALEMEDKINQGLEKNFNLELHLSNNILTNNEINNFKNGLENGLVPINANIHEQTYL